MVSSSPFGQERINTLLMRLFDPDCMLARFGSRGIPDNSTSIQGFGDGSSPAGYCDYKILCLLVGGVVLVVVVVVVLWPRWSSLWPLVIAVQVPDASIERRYDPWSDQERL